MNKIIDHWINIYRISIKNSPKLLNGSELKRFIKKQNKFLLTLELLKSGIISESGIYDLITNMKERVLKANDMLNNNLSDDERQFILSDIDKSNNTIKKLEKIL